MTARQDLLIEPLALQSALSAGVPCMVFDCSFDLMQPHAGEQAYLQTHIPGAVYAHLDRDLSAAHGAPRKDGSVLTAQSPAPASGGRHPLPHPEVFAAWLSRVGFRNDMLAVVYDRNGTSFAGRLWWMLRWVGHAQVRILDGGLQAWQAAQLPVHSGTEASRFQSSFVLGAPLQPLRTVQQVEAALNTSEQTLVDARAPARYRGEVEPMDPVAGHIPGALNRPFTENFTAEGRFKPAEQLRAEFEVLLQGRDPATVVHHCGSGVTATPNILAMQLAGLGTPALFAGSWSEWCSAPNRPMVKGEASAG